MLSELLKKDPTKYTNIKAVPINKLEFLTPGYIILGDCTQQELLTSCDAVGVLQHGVVNGCSQYGGIQFGNVGHVASVAYLIVGMPREDVIEQLNQTISEHNNLIVDLKKKIEEKENQIKDLNTLCRTRDKIMDELSDKNTVAESLVSNLKKTLNKMENDLSKIERSIGTKRFKEILL
jgi:uncharacterized coiled-coil protein SlyX